jgi:hypothetical protein
MSSHKSETDAHWRRRIPVAFLWDFFLVLFPIQGFATMMHIKQAKTIYWLKSHKTILF